MRFSVFADNDTEILIDCDSRSRQEIYNHVVKMFGKSKSVLKFNFEIFCIVKQF